MIHDLEHVRRSRRAEPVICTWCPELIQTCDEYVTWGQVHDGNLGRMNMHPECERAYLDSRGLDEFSPSDMERGVPYE